jgi:flagellar hook assembly protein FlgD
MTKKELLKRLNEGPVRVKIDGKLRQLTRKAPNAEQKAAYKALDEGSNIGVWDMGTADITSIQVKDVESMIGFGLDTEKPSE